MKKNHVFKFIIIAVLLTNFCNSQNNSYSFIASKCLTITCNKTTNLIFPYSVQSIDRGSRDILVQQPKGTQNIVQLKAGKPNFSQTNLSIVTTDGQLYSFNVDYQADPSQLNIIIQKDNTSFSDSTLKQVIKMTRQDNPALSDLVAQKISGLRIKHITRDYNDQIKFDLNGIYINHDIIYFRFRLQNNSNVSFDVESIRFLTDDIKKFKRTATQETELPQVYTRGNFQQVQPDSLGAGIIAVPKFTLPAYRYLLIQVLERNGSRNLSIMLTNRQLKKAFPINDIN